MAKFLDSLGLTELVKKIKSYVDTVADKKASTVKTTVDAYTVNGKKISTNPTLAKGDVGLGNVDNVKQIPATEKGKASGVATLDANGKIPLAQLGNLDTDLYLIVTEFPKTGIKANKVYMKLSGTSADKNVYAEYVYTGDPSQTYDETKWEKLGEAQAKISAATTTNDGLMSASDKKTLDDLSKIGIATINQKGYVKSTGVAAVDKGEVTTPVNVVVKSDGTMYADLRAASDAKHGLIQTGYTADGNELALKVDADGKGYVDYETIPNDEIDALF